jgi:hypothetical protein
MKSRAIIAVLLALNSVVLLGQLWPAGAPPFARYVNIAFSMLFFGIAFEDAKNHMTVRGVQGVWLTGGFCGLLPFVTPRAEGAPRHPAPPDET